MAIELALYQPDIPQNAGTLLRSSACFGLNVHFIHPAGFHFSQKSFRRSAMDYFDHVDLCEHDSFNRFMEHVRQNERRLVLLTTKSDQSLYDFSFEPNDILMLGRESAGVPQSVAETADAQLRLPMKQEMRSLNVAMAGALALGEAMRQTKHFAQL